ncbi:MAG: 3-oxoacyl-[acyl-carrier-protein] reductase [Thermodesulfobacteriota bacterium]
MGLDQNQRVVVVTGGARGIGRAVCLALAVRGTHVYFNYSRSLSAAQETEVLIRKQGGQATAVAADVSKENEVKDFFGAIVDESGRLDVLVNNAGITRDGLIPRMSEQDWDDVLAVNLKGAFLCMKAASRQMLRQRSGRIINISSVVGLTGNPGQANYAASKAGLIGLTRSVAAEFASRNITVNAVAAGLIHTDMTAVLSAEEKKGITEKIPLGRIGEPEDVAGVVAFLASDQAAYITGQVIHVNGGLYMG